MDEFNPILNYGVNGKETHADTLLGLEQIRNEIVSTGMSKEIFHRAESLVPGSMTSYGINVRKLTINPSDTGRKLGMEAVDVAAAVKGAAATLGTGGTIAVGAALAGGVGYALYRFYKWFKSKLDGSKKEPSDKSSFGTASAASGNYTAKVEKIPVPTDDTSKKIYEEKSAGKDAATSGMIAFAIASATRFEMQEATIRGLCDRVLKLLEAGDGANVIVYQLLQKKENVPPYWLMKELFTAEEMNTLAEYTKWVTALTVLVAKPVADGETLDSRVSSIIEIFKNGGISVSTNEFVDSNKKEGFLASMLKKLMGVSFAQKSTTLRDIIEGKKVGEVSERVHNTLADVAKGSYSIYAGLPGSGLSSAQKALDEAEFKGMLDLFNDDNSGHRAALESAITTTAAMWGAVAMELGKSDFTEKDAETMANLKADGNTQVGMAYAALSQAITKHAGYALRIKATLDQISAVLANISSKFKAGDE